MSEYDNAMMSKLGEIVQFTNTIDQFPLFEEYIVDYYLSQESIIAIKEYKNNNEEIIENDILGWALSKQISMGKTKGARGKRYLFWNTNAKNISETILELIGLQNYDITNNSKIVSRSVKTKTSEKSSIVISTTKINNSDRQRFIIDDGKKNNLKLIVSNKENLTLPFLIYRDFLPEKLPQSKSRGGRFAFSDLEKIGVISWGKINNENRWYLTDFGHALLEAIQSWIISYIISQGLQISVNEISVYKELTFLQKFDVLVSKSKGIISKSSLFKIFGTNQAIQHICISTFCLHKEKTSIFEEENLIIQDGIFDDSSIKTINSVPDLWNSLNQSIMIPVDKPVAIKRQIDEYLFHLNTEDAMILIPGKVGYGKTTLLGQILAKTINGSIAKLYIGGQSLPLQSPIFEKCIIAFDNINQLPDSHLRNLSSWFLGINKGIIIASIEKEHLNQFKQRLSKFGYPSNKLIIATDIEWTSNEIEAIANSISFGLNKKLDPKLNFSRYKSPFEFLVEYLPEIRILVRERFLNFMGSLFMHYGDWISNIHMKVYHFIILLSRVESIPMSYVSILLSRIELPEFDMLLKGEFLFLNDIISKEIIDNVELISLPFYYHNMIPSLETHTPIDSKNLNFAKLVFSFFDGWIDAIHVDAYLEYSEDKAFIESFVPFLKSFGDFGLAHINKFMPNYVDMKNNFIIDIGDIDPDEIRELISLLTNVMTGRASDIIILWFILQLSLHSQNDKISNQIINFMNKWFNLNFNFDERIFIEILEKNKEILRFEKNDQKVLLKFIKTSIDRGYLAVSKFLIDNFIDFVHEEVSQNTSNNLNLLSINLKIITKDYEIARKMIDKEMSVSTGSKYIDQLHKLSSRLDRTLGKTKPIQEKETKSQSKEVDKSKGDYTYTDFVKNSTSLIPDSEKLMNEEKWDKLKLYLQTYHKKYHKYMDLDNPHSKLVKIEYLRKMSVVKRVMLEIDEAKELLDESIPLAIELDDPEITAKIYGQLSQISDFKADYDDTINYLKESYKYSLQLDSHYLTIETLNKIGDMYGLVSEFSNAINWLIKAHELVKDCDEEHCKYQHTFTILNLARAYWFNGDHEKADNLMKSEKNKLKDFPNDFHKVPFRKTESKQEIQAKEYYLSNIKQNEVLDKLIEKIQKDLKNDKQDNIQNQLSKALDELENVNKQTIPIYIFSFIGLFQSINKISDVEEELIKFEGILMQNIAFLDIIIQLSFFSYELAFLLLRINKIDLARKWFIFTWLSSIVFDTEVLEYGIDANHPFSRYLDSEDDNEKTRQVEVMIVSLTNGYNLHTRVDVDEFKICLNIDSPNILIELVDQNQISKSFREYKTIGMIIFGYLSYILKHKQPYWPKYKKNIISWPENRLVETNGVIFATLGRYWDKNQEWEFMKYAYEKATSLNKNPNPYWFHLGYAYLRLGEYDAALNAYNQVSAIDPEDWDAKSNILDIYLLKKDYKKALQQIKNIKPHLSRAWDSYVSLIYYYEGLLIEKLKSDKMTAIKRYKKSIEKIEHNLPAIYRKFKLENEEKSFSDNQLKKFLLKLKNKIEATALDFNLDSSDLGGPDKAGVDSFEGILSTYYQGITKQKMNEIPESYIQSLHMTIFGHILVFLKDINLFREYLMKSFDPFEFIYNKEKMEEATKISSEEDDPSNDVSFMIVMYDMLLSKINNENMLNVDGKLELERLKMEILVNVLTQIQPLGQKLNLEEYRMVLRFIPEELLYEHYRYMKFLDYSDIQMQQEFIIDFYKSKGPLLRDLKKLDASKEVYEYLIQNAPAIHDGWIGMRDYYLLVDDIENSLKYSTELITKFPLVQAYKLDNVLLELYKGKGICNKIIKSITEIDEDIFLPIVEILKAYCKFKVDKDQARGHFDKALTLLLELSKMTSLSQKDRKTIHESIKQYGSLPPMGDLIARYLNHFIGKNPISIYSLLVWKLVDILDNNCEIDNIPETWMDTMRDAIYSLEPINGPYFYLPAMKMAVVYLEVGEVGLFKENLDYATTKWEPYLLDITDTNRIKNLIKEFPIKDDLRYIYGNILLQLNQNKDIQKQVSDFVNELMINALVIYYENNILDDKIVANTIQVLEQYETELLIHLLASSNQYNLRRAAVYISMVLLKRIVELLQK